MDELQRKIEDLWDNRNALDIRGKAATTAVREAIGLLDRGEARIAEIRESEVHVHDWLKKAILLLFQQAELVATEVGPFTYNDKIALKSDFAPRRVRFVPGASARWAATRPLGWC